MPAFNLKTCEQSGEKSIFAPPENSAIKKCKNQKTALKLKQVFDPLPERGGLFRLCLLPGIRLRRLGTLDLHDELDAGTGPLGRAGVAGVGVGQMCIRDR